ncbi:MAG: ABC transporter permease subunit [Anaerolineae bacterium]|nr:ABC transporter permease subunit [Anaerolineae bacterium]
MVVEERATTLRDVLRRDGLAAWFARGAKWYGTEWYITLAGAVILIAVFTFTLLATRLAPYDPEAFVGQSFARPGSGVQVLVVRSDNTDIEGPDSLVGKTIGVEVNSTAATRYKDVEGITLKKQPKVKKAFQDLLEGKVDAVVADEAIGRQWVEEHPDELKIVGQPFGGRFIMGTDNLGRDVFSRIIHGADTVLKVALLSAIFSALVGVPLGLLSGFIGGYLDRTLSLIMDSVYSFPGLILAIAMAAMLGPGVLNMAVAISVVYVPTYFRVVRGQTLSVKEELYVEAARSLGATAATILRLYVFPNVIPSIVVVFSMNIADAILTEAGLSFLGLGIDPSKPDWGYDLSKGKAFLPGGYWWIITFPGLMIALVALGFALLGEGLNEILNPRLTES